MTDRTINSEVTLKGAPASPSGRLGPGDEILGRYAVLDELGQGGMGVVYRCLDRIGGVEVAVKGLPPEVSHNEDEMEAIRRNFRLVCDLRHPHIAGVRTLERDGRGDYFLVMDLVKGESLSRWLRRHAGEAHRAAKMRILRDVAQAIDYAHGRKVIHRDLKPENVMVDGDGRAVALDFGLAAQIRSSMSRTLSVVTSTSGTPAYKAPEQWKGQVQRAPADVYSFGVLAWKVLTGGLPFEADDPMVLGHAVLFAEVPHMEGASSRVNAAFRKCLAKKPEDRFGSCGAFLDALEGGSGAPAAGRGRSTVGRKVAFALVALALAGAGVMLGVARKGANRPAAPAPAAREAAKAEAPATTAPAPTAREAAKAEAPAPAAPVPAAREAAKAADPAPAAPAPAAREAAKAEAPATTAPAPTAREAAKAEAPAPAAPAPVDRRREIAQIATLKTKIAIKTDWARERMKEAEAYRSDPGGFKGHLAAIDANWSRIEKAATPSDAAAAKSALDVVGEAADAIALELDWLKTNREGRDAARRIADGIAAEINPELKRFNAAEVAADSCREGETLRRRGQEAFERGEFADAQQALTAAKQKLAAAAAEAKSFHIGVSLAVAKQYFDAARWEKCVEEVDKVLACDSANAEAASLRRAARAHLEPEAGETRTITLPGGAEMELVYCLPGKFMMGSPVSEAGREDDERQHEVKLTRGFWLGKYEVTQRQWKSVMGNNPSRFKGDDRPVENVSWNDCQDFIGRVRSATGLDVRLPTEAEWEYACRAGTTSALPNGKDLRIVGKNNGPALDDIAWYGGNSCRDFELANGYDCSDWPEKQYSGSRAGTHPVGRKRPNRWGLYDMLGNVLEWCSDGYGDYPDGSVTDPTGPASGSYRVIRGGSWGSNARFCRSANRCGSDPGFHNFDLGFRLGCSAGPRGEMGKAPATTAPATREAPAGDGVHANPQAGETRTITLPGGAEMELVYCPPGKFMMGSPVSEAGRFDNEKQHEVKLTRGFWLGKYEVTQRQWKSVMGNNPSRFKGDDRPVENVSWNDCQDFIGRVRSATGLDVRLPTEAEWEYACRAGTTTALPSGEDLRIVGMNNAPALDDIAWYGGNSCRDFELADGEDCSDWPEKQYSGSRAGTHPVGRKRPNRWGLCDMLGNVWEWCGDWYGDYPEGSVTDPTGPASGSLRVLRGGGWSSLARYCRSADRNWDDPGYRSYGLGFRLGCSAGPRGEMGSQK
ncbi:MAG: bifunctional serine/threonine-protein kinase/formylglycine-generating enzyme family protein [Kiritimatiellia bacterium]